MILYFRCLDIGIGWVWKRLNENSSLEEIKQNDIPEYIRNLEQYLMNNNIALYLNTDAENNKQIGFIKDIDSYTYDENGRRYSINVALESEKGNSEECSQICNFVSYAREHKNSFVALMNDVIYYPLQKYDVDTNALQNIFTLANNEPTSEKTISLGNEQWKDHELDRRVFIYWSAPLFGYTIKRIDPKTGTAYRYGTEKGNTVSSQLVPMSQSILTNGGSKIVLYREGNRTCLLIKGMTGNPNQQNYDKKLSLIIDVPAQEDLVLKQLAAWALIENKSFAEEIFSYMVLYNDSRGFAAKPGCLRTLMNRFELPLVPDEKSDSQKKKIWNDVIRHLQTTDKSFQMIVLDGTLEYFCRLNEFKLTKYDIGFLVDSETMDRLISSNAPFHLIEKKDSQISDNLTGQNKTEDLNETKQSEKKSSGDLSVNENQNKTKKETGPYTCQNEEKNKNSDVNNSAGKRNSKILIPVVIGGVIVFIFLCAWIFIFKNILNFNGK